MLREQDIPRVKTALVGSVQPPDDLRGYQDMPKHELERQYLERADSSRHEIDRVCGLQNKTEAIEPSMYFANQLLKKVKEALYVKLQERLGECHFPFKFLHYTVVKSVLEAVEGFDFLIKVEHMSGTFTEVKIGFSTNKDDMKPKREADTCFYLDPRHFVCNYHGVTVYESITQNDEFDALVEQCASKIFEQIQFAPNA